RTLDVVSLVKGHCSPKVNILPVGFIDNQHCKKKKVTEYHDTRSSMCKENGKRRLGIGIRLMLLVLLVNTVGFAVSTASI
ncbi:hypothetical protein Tco_1129867, partial [Tanacetum coccineum]